MSHSRQGDLLFSGTEAKPACLEKWQPSYWQAAKDWQLTLNTFWQSEQALNLKTRIENRLQDGAVIFPPEPLRALELTCLADVKVVILGQDPYHGAGQAEGLAFSVPAGVKMPPSLRNIFKELERDLGIKRANTSLVDWAQQGVLLLNTVLTVEEGNAASHAGWGWELLTDSIIQAVAAKPEPVVFMLWGAHAQRKADLISQKGSRHLILQANHPSPLSALRPPVPFIGCGHFGLANAFLAEKQCKPIIW